MAKGGSQLTLFPELPEAARRRKPKLARTFFALWPDDTVRAALARAADLIPPGDAARVQRVRSDKYHITLAFLGMLEPRQIEAAGQAGDQVQAPAFRLVLDHVGHFAGPNVAWIGPAALPPALAQLKAGLDRELLRFGLPVAGGPFVPHLSCLRGVREAPDAHPVHIEWDVREFVLVKSVATDNGSAYKLLRRWPLLGTPAAG